MPPDDSPALRDALRAIGRLPTKPDPTVAARRRVLPEESRSEAIARFRRDDALARERHDRRRHSPWGQVLPVPGAE